MAGLTSNNSYDSISLQGAEEKTGHTYTSHRECEKTYRLLKM